MELKFDLKGGGGGGSTFLLDSVGIVNYYYNFYYLFCLGKNLQ